MLKEKCMKCRTYMIVYDCRCHSNAERRTWYCSSTSTWRRVKAFWGFSSSTTRSKTDDNSPFKVTNNKSRAGFETGIATSINSLSTTQVISATRINCHLYSFYPRAIRFWNLLPFHLRNMKDMDAFGQSLTAAVVEKMSSQSHAQVRRL